jgi:hypothetical protein
VRTRRTTPWVVSATVSRISRVGRWQRNPNKINMLAHTFKVSDMSRFPPPAYTESVEDRLIVQLDTCRLPREGPRRQTEERGPRTEQPCSAQPHLPICLLFHSRLAERSGCAMHSAAGVERLRAICSSRNRGSTSNAIAAATRISRSSSSSKMTLNS